MTSAAALIFGIAGAVIFWLLSDRMVLAVRDHFGWEFGIGIYSLLDTVRHVGAALSGIVAAVIGYFLSARYSRLPAEAHRSYRLFFTCTLFVVSLALSMFLSGVAAYGGARAAGVGTGGWGWQFLFAIYGGPLVGLVLHLVTFFRTWASRHDMLFSFVGSALFPPIGVFFLSLLFHASFTHQTSAKSPNHALEPTPLRFATGCGSTAGR